MGQKCGKTKSPSKKYQEKQMDIQNGYNQNQENELNQNGQNGQERQNQQQNEEKGSGNRNENDIQEIQYEDFLKRIEQTNDQTEIFNYLKSKTMNKFLQENSLQDEIIEQLFESKQNENLLQELNMMFFKEIKTEANQKENFTQYDLIENLNDDLQNILHKNYVHFYEQCKNIDSDFSKMAIFSKVELIKKCLLILVQIYSIVKYHYRSNNESNVQQNIWWEYDQDDQNPFSLIQQQILELALQIKSQLPKPAKMKSERFSKITIVDRKKSLECNDVRGSLVQKIVQLDDTPEMNKKIKFEQQQSMATDLDEHLKFFQSNKQNIVNDV